MTRREDGFRVADRHQVRIESLEKKLRHAIDERDTYRRKANELKAQQENSMTVSDQVSAEVSK